MLSLVTGATGHLGGNLVRALVGRGDGVRALVHRRPGQALGGLDVQTVAGDVRNPADMDRACAGIDVCYHLAAVISISGDKGGGVVSTNVEGVRTVARAARRAGVNRFVHVSSVHAYDLDFEGALDESGPRAKEDDSAYNRAKRDGEAALREEIAAGLPAVIVNPSGVLGPGDFEPSRMGRFFLGLARRRIPALVEGGFDWVDVRDVVAAILAAAGRGKVGDNYFVTGRWASIRQLAQMAAAHTGMRPPRLTVPVAIARIGAPFSGLAAALAGSEPLYTSESLNAVSSRARFVSKRAAGALGHAPRGLEETVEAVHEDFRARGLLPARGAP
ncbi:MAG TPA: NAD-dependent epimerase/dehydratase family protein [Candidatus Polarisedimenticolia bacterium]|jgi:dihydroflavonol-4-reductase